LDTIVAAIPLGSVVDGIQEPFRTTSTRCVGGGLEPIPEDLDSMRCASRGRILGNRLQLGCNEYITS
jgi:hypothetical protein